MPGGGEPVSAKAPPAPPVPRRCWSPSLGAPRPGKADAGEEYPGVGGLWRHCRPSSKAPVCKPTHAGLNPRAERTKSAIGGRQSAVGRSRQVATAVEGVVYFLHGDHLGSKAISTPVIPGG